MGAVCYRLIIPVGLVGTIVLAFPVSMVVGGVWLLFLIYPAIVLAVAYCSIRNAVLAKGWTKLVAVGAGLLLTGLAAVLAFGLFLGYGGI